MHRSGTSLLAEMLRDCGVFLGRRTGEHTEARFFVELNRWILEVTAAKWDSPEPALLLSGDELDHVVEFIDETLRSPRSIEYLGPRRYLRHGDPRQLGGVWGWKDPRNSFTLPVWLRLMPELRVVRVVRHGIDVADSLRARQATHRDRTTDVRSSRRYRLRSLAWALPRPNQHVGSLRCRSLEGAFELWEAYVDAEQRILASLPEGRVCDFRYEDLVGQPEVVLDEIAANLGVRLDGIAPASKRAMAERAFAYRDDESLVSFEGTVADRLEQRGYPSSW